MLLREKYLAHNIGNPKTITEIVREKARRNMSAFSLYTDARYQMNWHHALLCEYLDRFVKKEIRRMMVFMPPRHGKSELVSRKLPAYIFGRNPDAAVIATSYSADLAQGMNRDAQRIIDNQTYKELFPKTDLLGNNKIGSGRRYLRNSDMFEIVGHKGTYRCAGVGGGITGFGGDYIIIDDPIRNRAEANSSTYRESIWNWYASTLYTRLEKDACILLTQTRWHEDDLAGRLLAASNEPNGDKWTVISLSAVRDENDCPYDLRQSGDALWESKYDAQALAVIKTTVGSYNWAALYQQRPAPESGGLFKREWWRRWAALPTDLFDYLQSWDCAFKGVSTSDYVVGQVWARSHKNPADFYLIDQVRGRMAFTETVSAVRDLSAKWPKATRKLIEDKANGAAVMDVLKKEIPGLIAIEPQGGKVVRAHAASPIVESGNVFVPQNASWVGDYVEELTAFPNAANDDQVDATTQALIYYTNKPKANLSGAVGSGLAKESYWGSSG
jgi:predicted phage terminase large subunit-like protein